MDVKHIFAQRGAPGLAELIEEFAAVVFSDRPDLAEKMAERLRELRWVKPEKDGEAK